MDKKLTQAILERIRQYHRIILSRHIRPDGDAVGSTFGLREILRDSYPDKEIFVINEDSSEYLDFLGKEEEQLPDEAYADALLIVLDTATLGRISNSKHRFARETIKIDHHIDTEPYGDLSLVEDGRASTCEMVAAFRALYPEELKLSRRAATFLYTGMVTDTGRFRYREVNGDTLRLAAEMLDTGVDPEPIFSHLYLENFDYFKFKAYIYRKMKITANGVAYILIDDAMQRQFGLSQEQAGTAVSFLDSIRGSLIWIAFIENKEKEEIRVRLRSRFLPVHDIAEHWRGGGHVNAAGATVFSREEVRALLREADRKLKNYKETNTGWL